MRKYEPVWTALKHSQVVTLEVHPKLLPRVKKAIIKEKNIDLGFKVMNELENLFLKFTVIEIPDVQNKVHLKVELKQSLGIVGIVI